MNRRLIITTLTVVGVLGTSSASPFKRASLTPLLLGTTKQKIVAIRGGSGSGSRRGPVEPASVAKLIGGMTLFRGVYCTLSPKSNFEAYGVRDPSPANLLLMRRKGIINLQMGVAAYSLLFKKLGINTFFALIGLLWAAETLHALLNNVAETTGPDKGSDLNALLIASATVYGALNKASWAPTAFRLNSVYFLVVGISCWFNPIGGMKAMGMRGTDRVTPAVIENIGVNSLITGTLQACLAWGVDPVTAFGYAFAVAVPVCIRTNFLSPEFAAMGIDKMIRIFWPALYAVGAADVLL